MTVTPVTSRFQFSIPEAAGALVVIRSSAPPTGVVTGQTGGGTVGFSLVVTLSRTGDHTSSLVTEVGREADIAPVRVPGLCTIR